MREITASTLFAGSEHRSGQHSCFYCGAYCDGSHDAQTHVKPTFTNRDIVAVPVSQYLCHGCYLSLGDGSADMPMLDGTIKAFTTPRGMAPRLYSWLLTAFERLAFTKAHIPLIRDILTDSAKLPEPPFAVVLSDSGQKQLIFRAPVAHERTAFPILLEDGQIVVEPIELARRIAITAPIVAATGKPALKEAPSIATWIAMQTYHGGDARAPFEALEEWERIRVQPLSRLAAWLAPNKEEAQNIYKKET